MPRQWCIWSEDSGCGPDDDHRMNLIEQEDGAFLIRTVFNYLDGDWVVREGHLPEIAVLIPLLLEIDASGMKGTIVVKNFRKSGCVDDTNVYDEYPFDLYPRDARGLLKVFVSLTRTEVP